MRDETPGLVRVSRCCGWCGRDFGIADTGRRRRYCAQSCRQRAYEMRRLAHALGLAEQKCELVDPRLVYKRDKWRCGICGNRVNPKLKHPNSMRASLDHIVPLSRGGGHTYANCQCAHLQCNVRKNNRGGGEQLALEVSGF